MNILFPMVIPPFTKPFCCATKCFYQQREGKLVRSIGFVACQLRPSSTQPQNINHDAWTQLLLGGNDSHFTISHVGGHGRNLSRMYADSAPGSNKMAEFAVSLCYQTSMMLDVLI